MTLLDAHEVDPAQVRKRKMRIMMVVAIVVVVLGIGVLGFVTGHGWWFSYWPQERVVGKFFAALQRQDYKTAYVIWQNDPDWEKHLDRKPIHDYPYGDFYRDWGPGGEWGLIKTEKVYGASKCPPQGAGDSGTGVVVDVIVNDRVQHAQVWVESSDHTLSFPPCELVFH
jgi:hypothetical protein